MRREETQLSQNCTYEVREICFLYTNKNCFLNQCKTISLLPQTFLLKINSSSYLDLFFKLNEQNVLIFELNINVHGVSKGLEEVGFE